MLPLTWCRSLLHPEPVNRIRPLVVASLLCTLVQVGVARADQGEWQFGAGGGAYMGAATDDGGRVAPIGALSVTYALTDYWQLGLGVVAGAEVLAPTGPHGLAHVLLDGRFVLDAMTWVPYFTFGVGALIRDDPLDQRTDMTAHVGLGVDYRPSRQWSAGLIARYHFVLTDFAATVGPVEISLGVRFYLD